MAAADAAAATAAADGMDIIKNKNQIPSVKMCMRVPFLSFARSTGN